MNIARPRVWPEIARSFPRNVIRDSPPRARVSHRRSTFLSFFFNEPRNTASRRRSSGRLNRGRAEQARKARRFCRSRKPPRAVNPLSPSLSSGERPASLAGSRLVRTHAKETRASASAIDGRTDGWMDCRIAGFRRYFAAAETKDAAARRRDHAGAHGRV